MAIVEYERNGFLISTNKTKLDVGLIHHYLADLSYWAQGRALDVVKKSIQNSLCFGVFHGSHQIGFARVVTDYAVFAYMCDVFILEAHRGQGLGKWLVECISRHPDLQSLRRFLLTTADAQDLYARFGFTRLEHPEWLLERQSPKPSTTAGSEDQLDGDGEEDEN